MLLDIASYARPGPGRVGRRARRCSSDWDLDLDADRRDSGLSPAQERAPKLVHKFMLSMPPGTSPKGVLVAARNFAREDHRLHC